MKFRKKPTKEAADLKALGELQGTSAGTEPSKRTEAVHPVSGRGQPSAGYSRMLTYENGMGVSIGRLREDTVYDWKFIGLSHNTVRGAAGGAVLCAETLKAQGYIQAK